MADSEIRISTRVDNSRLTGDLNKTTKEVDKLTASFDRTVQSIKRQEVALAEMRRKLEAINSGEKTPASLSAMEGQLKKIDRERGMLQVNWENVGRALNNYKETLGKLQSQKVVDPEKVAEAKNKVAELTAAFDDMASKEDRLSEITDRLKSKISEIKLSPETSAEARNLAEKISIAEERLISTKSAADGLKSQIENATSEGGTNFQKMGEAAKSAGNSIKKIGSIALAGIAKMAKSACAGVSKLIKNFKILGKSSAGASSGISKLGIKLGTLIKNAFIFNVISAGLRKLREGVSSHIKSTPELSGLLNGIKVDLLTAFAPIWQTIQPALVAFLNVVRQVHKL